MDQKRFAYLSSADPKNKKVWSGTHYSIYRALSEIGTVDILGPYEPKWRMTVSKVLNQISLLLFKKRISYRHGIFVSKGYGAYFTQKLRKGRYDLVVAPAASSELAFVETQVPILYITDGTFAGCLNYHKSLTGLSNSSIEQGNAIEQIAISKSKVVLVSSQWAANSVINDYHKESDQVKVLPFGANLEGLNSVNEINNGIPEAWKLIFVGVYWQSKGGDIAFHTFRLLKEKGYKVSFTVLGCIPPEDFDDPDMTVIPFIDKNDKEGQKKMMALYREHHFLLLPTRFDCTPMVINEASAFGVPSLVANSGGVAGHLKDGKNGFLIEYNDKGPGYAKKIEEMMNAPERYQELRENTRKTYEDELNWAHWTEEFKKIL